MRVIRFLKLVALLAVSAVGASATYGQAPYPTGGYLPPVNFSEASYNDLLRRVDALEGKVDEDDGGCKEVDVLAKPTQKWSGRVHFDWWPFPDADSPLVNFLETGDPTMPPQAFVGFRRLRFGVAGDINETMNYKIEMEFANPGTVAFKDAYLGWKELPYLRTLLLGNQKRPYGLDHLNSSRYNVFLERPYVVEAFNQDARRIGLCSYGVSEEERWNWRYGVFLMRDLQFVGFQRDNNYESEVAGRLANTIWYDETSGGRGYAHWAVSAAAAFPSDGDADRFRTRPEARTANRWIDTGNLAANNYQLLGLEGVLNIGAFSVVGEYMYSNVNQVNGNSLQFGGGYVYAAYWLTGEHTPWERESGTLGRTKPFTNFFKVRGCDCEKVSGLGAWQIAARYSHGDFTDDTIFGGVGDSGTLGLNWWWNPNARMQFNYIYGNINNRVVAFPATQGNYQLLGMRFMVDF